MPRLVPLRSLVGFSLLTLMLSTVPLTGALAQPAGLIAWWTGDHDARSATGPQYDGTLLGRAQAGVPGLLHGAFQVGGAGDRVQTPLLLPAQGTIALWVKPPDDLPGDVYGMLGTAGRSNGQDRLWLTARGGAGGFGLGPHLLGVNIGSCCVNEIIVPSPLLKNTWTHLALTFDSPHQTFALYLNGSLAASVVHPPGPSRQLPTPPLDLGGVVSDFGQAFLWQGLLDNVMVCDHVLTPAQIAAVGTPDVTPPAITITATPATLWPPNGRMVTVTVAGTVTGGGSGVIPGTATYRVIDAYGQVQPMGSVPVHADGTYTFQVLLQASRHSYDTHGRQYTIVVSAQDEAGNTGSATATVHVPHDQGH